MTVMKTCALAAVLAAALGTSGLAAEASASGGVSGAGLPDDFGVADASALSPTDAWVVGLSPTTQAKIEHWDGGSWSAAVLPPLDSLTVSRVQAITANDVWALGSSADADGHLFLHWDGSQWLSVDSPDFPGESVTLRSLSATAPDDIWAVGERSRGEEGEHTLAEHWDGQRWSFVATPHTPPDIWTQYETVSAVSSSDVWAVGFSYDVVKQTGRRFITHWDGASWTRSHGVRNTGSIGDIEAISADDVWVAASTGSQSLLQHWDGDGWTTVRSPGPGLASAVDDLDARSSNDVWGVGLAITSEKTQTSEPMILHWTAPRGARSRCPANAGTRTPCMSSRQTQPTMPGPSAGPGRTGSFATGTGRPGPSTRFRGHPGRIDG